MVLFPWLILFRIFVIISLSWSMVDSKYCIVVFRSFIPHTLATINVFSSLSISSILHVSSSSSRKVLSIVAMSLLGIVTSPEYAKICSDFPRKKRYFILDHYLLLHTRMLRLVVMLSDCNSNRLILIGLVVSRVIICIILWSIGGIGSEAFQWLRLPFQ